MSEHGFHIHTHHEQEIEHGNENRGIGQWVAIFTAILASIGAIISYQNEVAQYESLMFKNEAVLWKAQASDMWNYYQSKSTKQHLMELALEIGPPEKKAYYMQQIERYEKEKNEIKRQAEEFEAKSKKANEESSKAMIPHHYLALSMTLIQIAISLASITVLTRKKWLFFVAFISAIGGILLWIRAFFL